jgi:AcrR family transcriptional regulator
VTSKPSYHHGDLREALLRAAESELAEKGVEAFSLRGCARRAGVSHAAPAHHFPTADHLLTALAGVGFARLTASMRRHAEAAAPEPEARLIALGLGYIAFAEADPALFKLMFGSDRPSHDDAAFKDCASAAFGTLVDAVAAIRGAPPLASAEGTRQLSAAWAVVHGLAHLLIERRMPFLDGIAAPERPAMLGAIIAGAATAG